MKVGDRRIVRKDLRKGQSYGGVTANGEMEAISGKQVTINNVSANSRTCSIEEDVGWTWTEDMFEPVETKRIKAYELMKLAADNPSKYNGKKYRVIQGQFVAGGVNKYYSSFIIDTSDSALFVSDDKKGFGLSIYASQEVEEIPDPPKEVSFMEAITQWNPIKHKAWDEFVSINRALNYMSNAGIGTIHEMAKDKWLIKED
jgi:hypothetical protein